MNITSTSREITKKMTEIENYVKKRLMSFYNKEIKPYATISPAETLRRIHEDQVKAIIRRAIQDAYVTGTQIVGDEINERVQFDTFISSTDLGNIQRLTTKLNDDFWRTVSRLVQRENEFVVVDNELEQKKSFDADAAITGVSSDIAHQSFNESIVSKLQEAIHYIHGGQFVAGLFRGGAGIARIAPAIGRAIPFQIPFGYTGFTEPPPLEELSTEEFPIQQFTLDLMKLGGRIMFLTKEDEKVDPEICDPLNRTEYDVDDPDIPLPPLHRYCRCRLVPLIQEEQPILPMTEEQF
jgi:hypothetical protein